MFIEAITTIILLPAVWVVQPFQIDTSYDDVKNTKELIFNPEKTNKVLEQYLPYKVYNEQKRSNKNETINRPNGVRESGQS